MKIIYAFGDSDPAGDDIIGMTDYHYSNRGKIFKVCARLENSVNKTLLSTEILTSCLHVFSKFEKLTILAVLSQKKPHS